MRSHAATVTLGLAIALAFLVPATILECRHIASTPLEYASLALSDASEAVRGLENTIARDFAPLTQTAPRRGTVRTWVGVAYSSRGVPRNVVTDAIRRICTEPGYVWGDEANTNAAIWICEHESGFRVGVPNASGSSARGLGQLIADNREKYGVVDGDMESEIRGMLNYIRDRYRTPVRAWAFWLVNEWY